MKQNQKAAPWRPAPARPAGLALVITALALTAPAALKALPAAAAAQCPRDSHEVSFDHLKREGSFCPVCDDHSSQGGVLSAPKAIANSVPALRCFQKSVSEPIQRHTICPNGDESRLKKAKQRICFSAQYMSDTARAFRDVTKCLGLEKPEYFFALINRESRFQITARSRTNASCYGQLTAIAIADVNLMLQRQGGFQGKDAQSCSSVSAFFETMQTMPARGTGRGYRKPSQTVCAAHSNPYSCLMYSAMYYRHSLRIAERAIDDADIVIVTMKGRPKERLIFKSRAEFERHFEKPGNSKKDIAEENSLSLLQDKETAAYMLAFQSYNGGYGSARSLFRRYINNIKGRIWGGGGGSQTYVKQIFSKKPYGITPGDFLETFTKWTANPSDRKRGQRRETRLFPANVLNDYQRVTGGMAPACGNIPYRELTRAPRRFTAPGMI